ncbi:riboflavin synthase [Magnolia sinica]|uniref:riboflavin synthase n=1 Tax=Magnolia sinica TaxID=86752 RepID=UPI00265B4952|nr:riboflavin synthase [Magnolia sinica]XP_058100537.1 riboflavin synthase [Magnolia sinica]XP_058100538.1 riboflavin synthase [Magnolia sinica]XP_058100539.1 riboflavin synthase [Magnolia sinica]
MAVSSHLFLSLPKSTPTASIFLPNSQNSISNLPPNHTKNHLTFNPNSRFQSISLHLVDPLKPKTPSLHRSYYSSPIRSLFTGIVEEMGQIKQLGFAEDGGFEMKISAKTVLSDLKLGDSIAVNGTCLTVTEFDTTASDFMVGLAPETLRKTSLIELEPGSLVNLERSLQPTSRMGGHFVQGHVDGTGEIMSRVPEGDSLWVKIRTLPELLKFIVPKGYIAVDGTSLTVVNVFEEEGCFDFMLVAYTQQNVVIPFKKVGQKVNLEVDIIGKYVERLLRSGFVDSIHTS